MDRVWKSRRKKRALSARAVARLPRAERNRLMHARAMHEVIVAPAGAEEQLVANSEVGSRILFARYLFVLIH